MMPYTPLVVIDSVRLKHGLTCPLRDPSARLRDGPEVGMAQRVLSHLVRVFRSGWMDYPNLRLYTIQIAPKANGKVTI